MPTAALSKLSYDQFQENALRSAEPGVSYDMKKGYIDMRFHDLGKARAAADFLEKTPPFATNLDIHVVSDQDQQGFYTLVIGRANWLMAQIESYELQNNISDVFPHIMQARFAATSFNKIEGTTDGLAMNGQQYNTGRLRVDCGSNYDARELKTRLLEGIESGAIKLSPLEKAFFEDTKKCRSALVPSASGEALVSNSRAKGYDPVDQQVNSVYICGIDSQNSYGGGLLAAVEMLGAPGAAEVRQDLAKKNVQDAFKHRVGEGNGGTTAAVPVIQGPGHADGVAADQAQQAQDRPLT